MNSNGRILAGAGVLFLSWAVITGASVAWRLLFMWLTLVLLLHLLLRYWSANLTCSVELRPKGGSHEGDFEITYIFANNGLMPVPWCEVSVHLDQELGSFRSVPEPMAFSVSEIKTVKKDIRCPRRGVYHIGGATVRFVDPLGIRSRRTHYDRKITIEVFPRKYPVESFVSSGGEEGGALRGSRNAEQDYASISRIRSALPQEPVRHIHWKASARTEELMMREYETRRRKGISIVLEGRTENYGNDSLLEERCVEVAAGLTAHWLSKGYAVELIMGFSQVLRLKGAESLETAMRALMLFRPEGNEPLYPVLSRTGKDRGNESALQVVTPGMTEQEAFAMGNMGHGAVTVFLVGEDAHAFPKSVRIVRIPA